MPDTHAELLQQLVPLLRQAAPQASDIDITAASQLDADLGFDSIGLLTFAFLLEENFGLDVASQADAFRAITSVGDIIQFLAGARKPAILSPA